MTSGAACCGPDDLNQALSLEIPTSSLRRRGAILLISCYELGHQPLNLASPLGSLIQAGYQPLAVDTHVEQLADEIITGAELVAISVPMHTALRLAEQIARRVRELNADAHICVYGLYAWLNAEYLFEGSGARGQGAGETSGPECRGPRAGQVSSTADAHRMGSVLAPGPRPPASAARDSEPLADSVIGGEFEEPLLGLAQALEEGRLAGEGVRYPERYAAPHIRRLRFAEPVRSALPVLERYAGLMRAGERLTAGYVEASRGCKHRCLHCPITPVYNGRFFVLPPDLVLRDIRRQVASGARHITFGDPDFLNGPGHSLRIARAMHKEFPDVSFDATIKIEHILAHAGLMPELKQLGCAFVVSAVESLSDEVLRRLDKGHTAEDVARALDVMAAADIPLRPSLVAFTPWTTLDDYLALLAFVEGRDLVEMIDPVQYSIRLLVPPGSALLESAREWLGELDRAAFSYRWRHPDDRMDSLSLQVQAIVEEAECEQRDVWATFLAVKTAAYRTAGLPAPAAMRRPASHRPEPPRLTESWFCCAEPVRTRLAGSV